MRIEDAGPRTRLLAAVAGAAVLVWALAVAGMGGRVAPLDDTSDVLAPLPTLPAAPTARPDTPGGHEAIAARPLFSPDRTPQPFFLENDDGEQTQGFNYVLTSVLLTPRLQLAILQPPDGSASFRVLLQHGPEPHPAWRLVELDERSAVFEGPEGRRTLPLRVFDGVGGLPPTVLRTTDGAADGQGRASPAVPAEAPARRVDGAPEPVNPDDLQAPVREQPPAPASPDGTKQDASGTAAEPPATTDAAQMDLIRQRIQARREKLRNPPAPEPPGNNR
ncbi:type II secretion system protein XpsN [Lysobacter sp. A421]